MEFLTEFIGELISAAAGLLLDRVPRIVKGLLFVFLFGGLTVLFLVLCIMKLRAGRSTEAAISASGLLLCGFITFAGIRKILK